MLNQTIIKGRIHQIGVPDENILLLEIPVTNLTVGEGEIVTIIDANGASKTTTMQTIYVLTTAAGVRDEIAFAGSPSIKSGYEITKPV